MTSDRIGKGMWEWHEAIGVSRIINVSGTMTALGGSVATEAVQLATAEAMVNFVDIHQLQARASEAISRLTGAEAGCMTSSASAGVTLGVAACITGLDPSRVEALPDDPGLKNEVAIQLGHMCSYGAPVETSITITGARVRKVGQSTHVMDHQLEGALGDNTAAAVFVVSHHVVNNGQIPLPRFIETCHARNVPVVVDAASEYDLTGILAVGADLVVYSSHKFLGGPTGGIIAGRRDLVRAAYLQNIGIGRGMKIGKESIAGAIAAMEQWIERDHKAHFEAENVTLSKWKESIEGISGISARIVPDPTGNPLNRLRIDVDHDAAGATAAGFVGALADGDPPIIARYVDFEPGYFELDPCNLLPGQASIVENKLRGILQNGRKIPPSKNDSSIARNAGVAEYLKWLSMP